MTRIPDGEWYYENTGNSWSGSWHFNRHNYLKYIIVIPRRRKFVLAKNDGDEQTFQFPDEVQSEEEMKAYALAMWRMS